MKLNQPRNKILVLILIIGLFAFPSLAGVTTIGDTITAVSNIISNGAPHIDVRAYGAVGDGVTDDTTAINNALAGSRSKTVSCAGGVFNVTTLNIPAHTAFVGNGNCTLRWYTTVAVQTAMIQNTNQASGLGVDTDITISGITFDDFGWSPGNTRGIYFKNVTHATIKNNVFKNFSHALAAITPNAFLLIEGNDFYNFGVGGTGDAITLTGGTTNSMIIGNILNTTHGDATVDGIILDENSTGIPAVPGRDNLINGNTINGTGVGIVIEGSHNNTVVGNVIVGTAVAGVSLSEGQAVTAPQNNQISNNIIRPLVSSDGIRIIGYSIDVHDNTIVGGDNAIFMNDITSTNSPNRDISIKNNQISYSSNDAIYMDECVSCSIQGNTISNTSSSAITALTTNGKLIDITIKDNKISRSKLYGIDAFSNAYAMDKIDISNNNIFESGWGTPATYEAIFVSTGVPSSNNFTIQNNVISSNQTTATEKAGIFINAGVAIAMYSNNYLITQNNAINLYSGGYTVASPPAFIAPRGTVVWNSAPSSGATPGWVNVDGTAAGWKAMGNLA